MLLGLIEDKLNDPLDVGLAHRILGDYYESIGRITDAETQFQAALDLALSAGPPLSPSSAALALAVFVVRHERAEKYAYVDELLQQSPSMFILADQRFSALACRAIIAHSFGNIHDAKVLALGAFEVLEKETGKQIENQIVSASDFVDRLKPILASG